MCFHCYMPISVTCTTGNAATDHPGAQVGRLDGGLRQLLGFGVRNDFLLLLLLFLVLLIILLVLLATLAAARIVVARNGRSFRSLCNGSSSINLRAREFSLIPATDPVADSTRDLAFALMDLTMRR